MNKYHPRFLPVKKLAPCPVCSGTGTAITGWWHYVTCGYCAGTGKIDSTNVQGDIVKPRYEQQITALEQQIAELKAILSEKEAVG